MRGDYQKRLHRDFEAQAERANSPACQAARKLLSLGVTVTAVGEVLHFKTADDVLKARQWVPEINQLTCRSGL